MNIVGIGSTAKRRGVSGRLPLDSTPFCGATVGIEYRSKLTLYISVGFFALAFLALGTLFVENAQLNQHVFSRTLTAIYIFVTGLFTVHSFWLLRRSRQISLLVFLSGHVFWFAGPALLALLGFSEWYGQRQYYFPISERDVSLTSVFLLTHLFMFLVAYRAASAVLQQYVIVSKSESTSYELSVLYLIIIGLMLLFLGLLPMVLSGLQPSEIWAGVLSSRSLRTPWATTVTESNFLSVAGRVAIVSLASISLMMVLHKGNNHLARLVASAVFISLFLISYFETGTRSWTMLIVLPPLLVWLSQNLGRLRLYWVILGPMAMLGLLWLLQFQLHFRNTGLGVAPENVGSMLELRDNDFFNETAIAIGLVPRRMNFIYESLILTHLTNPIPRTLWPEKPYAKVIRQYSFGRDGYDIYFLHGISRLPSVVGQSYMSWGAWGVLQIGLLTGVLLAWLDFIWQSRNYSRLTHLWIAMVLVWILVSFRGFFPGFHYPVVIIGLIVLLEKQLGHQLEQVVRRKRRLIA